MVNVNGRASDDAQSIIDPPSNASRSAAVGILAVARADFRVWTLS
jgi:hypothetical protein